ncbi:protein PFC0760c-like [Lytechinus variegatus]|uniref:protein PFC0760c-like n=1 Tax=Lytechinus variegatus TaxID=7654 RepID=UPI001BB2847D|nr:protein PFC0760c-like [Lytechinus variegatus]
MEFLRVGILLIFHVFFFSGYSQSRSLRPREKENDVLNRAVRDLFMIYQEESLKTRLVGVIRGEAGKSLNESEDHVTNEQGQISSDGNFTGLADMSTFLLETNKQGEDNDDNKKKDLLLRIYSILRKTSQKADVNESDDEQDIENHRGEADDDSLSAYSKPNHHITSMPLIGKFPSNPTNDSNINMSDYSAINESKLTALANETRTNVDWSYIPYPNDSTTKLNDDGELVVRNAIPTTIDDVEFTNNMYPTNMTDGGDGGQDFFENKRNEQDIGYFPRTMSGEKKDELSGDKERNHDYDFMDIKRSEINFHYHSDVALDNSTRNNLALNEKIDEKYKNNDDDDEVDVEDDDSGNDDGEGNNDDMDNYDDDDDKDGHIHVVDDYAADEDDVHDDGYDEEDAHYDNADYEDDGDGNDNDDGDHGNNDDDDSNDEYDQYENKNNEDTLLLATKPNDNDKEWISTYHNSDNQGTFNHVIQTNTNEEGDDHHDNHGRTSIEDEDAERFLRWILKYILRRMDDGSKSERNQDVDQELLPSEGL